MFWCDFMAGWVGGKIYLHKCILEIEYFEITGCAGLLVGHPFDTLKVSKIDFSNS